MKLATLQKRPESAPPVVAPPPEGKAFLARMRESALGPVLSMPLFWAMLAAKLLLASLFASHYLRNLFVPFVNYFVESGLANPWEFFLTNGRPDAFPYPPGMLYLLALPRLALSPFFASGVETVTWFHTLAMRLPLLACDLGCFCLLLNWFPNRPRLLLGLYWCSPLVIYVTYCHGQLDLVPTALLLASVMLVQKQRFLAGLALFGVCLGTKSHVAVALPFLLCYLYPRLSWRGLLKAVATMAVAYLAVVGPYLGSPAFWQMVFQNPEQGRLFALSFSFGLKGQAVLVAPLVLGLLWFQFVSYRKWNWDLLVLYLGLAFCVFVLVTPPAPAYFLWPLPFLIYFLARNTKATLGIYWVFMSTYVLYYAFAVQPSTIDELTRVFPAWGEWRLGEKGSSLLFTGMEGSLIAMILGIYHFGVRKNAIYSRQGRPISIGVAGDSGSGKDRFVDHLLELFGRESVTSVFGDDYHRWPRGHENWREYTPLHPGGNHLHLGQAHALELMKGRKVTHRMYDHGTGQFREGNSVAAKDILVFSGLHSLALESTRALYDLKIFIDPDEQLRRYWKVRRDVRERGHKPADVLKSLDKRETDRVKFILPQREHADLVLHPVPAEGETLNFSSDEAPRLRLEMTVSNSLDLFDLVRGLTAIPTLKIVHDPFRSISHQFVSVEGTVDGSVLLRLCRQLIPSIEDLSMSPQFPSDQEGCAVLLLLCCLDQQLQLKAHRAA